MRMTKLVWEYMRNAMICSATPRAEQAFEIRVNRVTERMLGTQRQRRVLRKDCRKGSLF